MVFFKEIIFVDLVIIIKLGLIFDSELLCILCCLLLLFFLMLFFKGFYDKGLKILNNMYIFFKDVLV